MLIIGWNLFRVKIQMRMSKWNAFFLNSTMLEDVKLMRSSSDDKSFCEMYTH